MNYDLNKYVYKIEGNSLIVEEKETFESWVAKINEVFDNDRNCIYFLRDNSTYVADLREMKLAKSTRHPNDKFELKTGIAIAYARLKNLRMAKEVDDESERKKLCDELHDTCMRHICLDCPRNNIATRNGMLCSKYYDNYAEAPIETLKRFVREVKEEESK